MDEGTYFLCRVIFYLQLNAGALAGNQYTSKDTGLYPYLSTFTYNKAFWCRPQVRI
jgi:hypothetical protein